MDIKPKFLFHGSCVEIKDGFVRARPGCINDMKTSITAVFATSSFMHAKVYACMRVIAHGWQSPGINNTMYIQGLWPDIAGKKVYIYELDSDGFERDGPDYYSLTDKKIKKVYEFDVMQEIKNGNIKVYVLKDEFNTENMSRNDWRKIQANQSKFELYNPNINHIDTMMLNKTMENSGLDK